MATRYWIPGATVQWEQEIKKSRFIAVISRASMPDEAKAQVQRLRQQHQGARHFCWAFIAGNPSDTQCCGFSDDGEPSGTAGKPILAQLNGSGYGEICAVVIRYSSGIKLGTGGLVRAYGGSTKQALNLLPVEPFVQQQQLKLAFDFNCLGIVEESLARFGAEKLSSDYHTQVSLVIDLDVSQVQHFSAFLTDMCRGKVTITLINQ